MNRAITETKGNKMKHLALFALILTGCATYTNKIIETDAPSYFLSDSDAGYNQAAYDECVDSVDSKDCDGEL